MPRGRGGAHRSIIAIGRGGGDNRSGKIAMELP